MPILRIAQDTPGQFRELKRLGLDMLAELGCPFCDSLGGNFNAALTGELGSVDAD